MAILTQPMPSIDDLFPEYKRELYDRARDVLLRVAFEVRFPRVLRLDSEVPAAFQEEISSRFPLYEKAANINMPQGMEMPPEFLQQIVAAGGIVSAHQFLSEDRYTVVNLSSERMGVIVNTVYTTWEDFREILELAISALTRHYKVAFFTRVGLRYQDVIHRETLGLQDQLWTSLINNDLLGAFPFGRFERNVTVANHLIAITLPNESGRMAIRHGLVNVEGKDGQAYGLDFDFSYQPKTEIGHVFERLDYFHTLAGRAFRWSITDELRRALGPAPLPNSESARAARA